MRSLRAVAKREMPHVLLLDTNIVVLSWRYRVGDEGYDLLGGLRDLARNGQERLALDLLSLDELFTIARIAGTPRFLIAQTTFEELGRSDEAESASVIRWASELATYDGIPDEWPFDAPSKRAACLLASDILGADAVLLAEAARLRADALLTCDYRLIRCRDAGLELDLVALTPFETEDWIRGCRKPPWSHTKVCRAHLARIALLRQAQRGLRFGDSSAEPVRAAN
jgi:hypothetical protein